jgi:hypothetical protein
MNLRPRDPRRQLWRHGSAEDPWQSFPGRCELNHLQIAVYSAREAYEIEQENAGEPFGSWFTGMMRLVPVSVVMSGAALEASVNELLGDILGGLTPITVSGSRRRLLSDLQKEKSGNARIKYRRLALLLDAEPDCGTEVWNNVRLPRSI